MAKLKLKYLLHVLSGVRFEKIKECLDRSHEISGKSKFLMLFDMGWCALRYGFEDLLLTWESEDLAQAEEE